MAGKRLLLLVMCVGYFFVLLDVTIVNVALPRLGSSLHAGVASLQWIVDGYAIALASLMLAGGAIGDRYGHRRVVLAGLAAFGAGSLLAGLAPTTAVLIAGRAVQGVGAALLLPGALAVITDAFPDRAARARAIGVWAGVGSIALPAGPILGGALIGAFGWRAIFLLDVPIVLLVAPLVRVVVGEHRRHDPPPLDPAGSTLAAAFLVALVFAFVEGGRDGFLDTHVLAAFAAAVALALLFVAVEVRRGPDAMLPLTLFRSRTFSTANAVAATMNFATLGVLFVLTLFLQRVQSRSPLEAGVALLPLFAPLAVVAPLAGRLTAAVGPRRPMTAGLLVSAVGLALLATVDPGSAYQRLLPPLLLWGIGLGILTPAVVAAALARARERPGLASATNNTARQAGGAVGIAVFGAIAGTPTRHGSFTAGLHTGAIAAAALYLLAAAATVAFVAATSSVGSLRQ